MSKKKSFKGFLKFFFSMKGIEEDLNEEDMQKFNKIQKIIDEQGWELPLNKEKIKTLEKLMEKYNLLYFIRKSNFHILYDYPFMGALERRLLSSKIDGPYELAPKVKKKESYSESSVDVLELLVPANSMLLELKNISLVEYGTQTDRDSQRFLELVAKEKINPKRMTEVGKRALENIRKGGVNIEKISDSVYRASVDDCVLEFTLAQSYYVYPKIGITVFGKGEKPQQLIQGLGLYELGEQFPSWGRDVGIKHCFCEGLAYDLSLKNLDLDKILAEKNIIL